MRAAAVTVIVPDPVYVSFTNLHEGADADPKGFLASAHEIIDRTDEGFRLF
jgi:hypothetical protein